MTLELPQEILDSARLTIPEVKMELAISLYAQRRLSIGKARELAGMSLWGFRQVLAARRVPPHYGTDDLEQDLQTFRAAFAAEWDAPEMNVYDDYDAAKANLE